MHCKHRILLLTACLLSVSALGAGCASPPADEFGSAQETIDRGKYLVTVMDCNGCHTPFANGEPDMTRMLSGHPQDVQITAGASLPADGLWGAAVNQTNTAWSGPWGVSFTTNLTPDENTGIGSWSENTFVSAIRTGRHMGVSREILPPMPWRMQANLTDQDIKAIYAYLRTIPAISNRVPEPIEPVR
jgi:hypothetical protein